MRVRGVFTSRRAPAPRRGRAQPRAVAPPARRYSAALAAFVTCVVVPAQAKRYAYSSPEGRAIYSPDEQFLEVADYTRRYFVVEVTTGLAPQGNLAILLGLINAPAKGIEFYAGYGVEANPAWTISGDVRYLLNIEGWRPYIGVGYSYRELYELDAYSNNLFAEVGYKWVLRPTYHMTLGVGVRRAISIVVRDTSPLRESDTNPALLDEAIDDARAFVPTLSLKFSRAF